MTWTKRVQIPEQDEYDIDDNVCNYRCPFFSGGEPGSACNIGLGIDNGNFGHYPGPDCPGPGWYVITKEDA